MPLFLEKDSQDVWESLAEELFTRARVGGHTKLDKDLNFVIVKPKGAQHVSCPEGSEVFFPNYQPLQAERKKDIRFARHCIIYCNDHILTLNLVHAGVVAKCTMLNGRVPVLVS